MADSPHSFPSLKDHAQDMVPSVLSKQPLPRTRANSSVSRVDLDFFDPTGVQDLRRTLTNQQDEGAVPEKCPSSCDTTLGEADESFNFQKVLRDAVQKRNDAHIKPRSLGVAFRNLQVVGVGSADTFFPTLGSLFSPSVILENLRSQRHPKLKNILQGFEGVVRPGEMLLVLGSPGSGCTTFLKTLSNHRKEYHSVLGDVHYDSLSPEDIADHFRGDVQYCPEDDVHFPTLTVDQTIHFAATVRTPRDRTGETREQFARQTTDLLTTLFGLRHAKNTPIGNAIIRGVSGGEKKRVSIAETLAARSCIGSWDNSTRGLDSSTALEFVKALRISTEVFQTTTIVSIYQAAESLYQHFDKVCVIYEGRMAYFGPADRAKQYFLDMGYEPANRQTTPDFLVTVTDTNARIPRAGFSNQPRTSSEFAEYFSKSEIGKANTAAVDDYLGQYVGKPDRKSAYVESAHAEFAKRSQKSGPYLLSIPQQVRAVMKRRVQIIKGDWLATAINLFTFIFQGIIVGTVFLKTPTTTSAFFSRGGVLFFSLLWAALTSMTEIPSLYAQRPIILRHQKAAFYHPFVEAVSLTLVDVPITIGNGVTFSIILYFLSGLQHSAGQFFVFALFQLIVALAMKSYFRATAAAFLSSSSAQTFAGISILALSIYTGYSIPKRNIVGALRWITHINPLKYAFEAVMTNEFRTLKGTCSNLIPQGPGYENITLDNQVCAMVGAVAGQPFVEGSRFLDLAFGFKSSNTWMNFGIVIAFGLAFTATLFVFAQYNTALLMDTPVALFKRTATSKVKQAVDEEKGAHDEREYCNTANTAVNSSPTPRMTDIFSWHRVSYTVPIDGQPDRKLLDDISGYVAPGKLSALMGESGAGKTTLLNVLAHRTDVGVVTGDRYVNGQQLPIDFQAQTGYCQQMDTHMPFATVREALLFSAKLRQPPSVSVAEKEAYVEKCLQMCGLEEYADAAVGTLNIEHRKRTTIGVELAAKPKLLLFLDEPTTGLDSQSAWAIISFLRTLANSGQAILCTIHQPSAELFQVFDRLLLLQKGGQTVYFGDLGTNATKLIHYFEHNGARPCADTENPAEYMLDVIGAGATATSSTNWHQIWLKSPEAVQVQREIEMIHTDGRARPPVEATLHREFATGWMYQTGLLLHRNVQAYWRDPTYIMAKLMLNALGGLFIGFTFWKSKLTPVGAQNQLFSLFMATILSVPLAQQLQVPFIQTRSVYEVRERPSRMYSWTALLTSQILIELPWNFFGSCLMFFTLYWTVGFETSRAGYSFSMMAIVFPSYYGTFGQAVAAMSPNPEIAAILCSFLFSFVVIFNGVLQPFSQLGWWKWMYHTSPYTYLIEGILGQAIGQKIVECSSNELVMLNPPSGQTCGQYLDAFMSVAGGYLTNPNETSACQFCNVRTTDQFLGRTFNIFYHHRWRNVGFMAAFTVFNIVLIFLLTYLFRIHKGSLIPSFKKH